VAAGQLLSRHPTGNLVHAATAIQVEQALGYSRATRNNLALNQAFHRVSEEQFLLVSNYDFYGTTSFDVYITDIYGPPRPFAVFALKIYRRAPGLGTGEGLSLFEPMPEWFTIQMDAQDPITADSFSRATGYSDPYQILSVGSSSSYLEVNTAILHPRSRYSLRITRYAEIGYYNNMYGELGTQFDSGFSVAAYGRYL
jgi:hypothetical protein